MLFAPETLPRCTPADRAPLSTASSVRDAAPGGSRPTCAGRSGAIRSTCSSRRPTPPRSASTLPAGASPSTTSRLSHIPSGSAHGRASAAAGSPAAPPTPRLSSSPTRSSRARSSKALRIVPSRASSSSHRASHERPSRRMDGRASRWCSSSGRFQPPAPPRPHRRLRRRRRRILPAARLVIVGGDRTWPPPRSPGRGGRARRWRSNRFLKLRCRIASWRALRARVGVRFLSEYEGFGLTPLEALSAGVPPVVLDTAVAREVYGDAACLRRPRRHRWNRGGPPPLLDGSAERSADARARTGGRCAAIRGTRQPTQTLEHDREDCTPVTRLRATALDHHRQLQRARGSGALPGVPPRAPAVDRARHHVVDNASTDGGVDAFAPDGRAVQVITLRIATGDLPRATTRGSARHAATLAVSSSTATPSCRRSARHARGAPAGASDGGGGRTSAGRRGRPRRVVVWPHDLAAHRAAPEGARTPLRGRRLRPSSMGRARDAAGTDRGLGQRSVFARVAGRRRSGRACSTSGSFSIPKTSTSAPRCVHGAGAILFTPAGGGHPCLRGRSRASAPGQHECGVPSQPDRVLREASSGVGAAVEAPIYA